MNFLESLNTTKLDFTNLVVIPNGGSNIIGLNFALSPKDFLKYAKEDLYTRDARGVINSISNAKRAIDCQVDCLLSCFGIDYDKPHKSTEGFVSCFNFDDDISYKLKIIQCLNLAPSFIISKYRNLRNKLEHLYQLPLIVEAKEAVDIAELFIRSIEGYYGGLTNYFHITDINNYIDEYSFRNGYDFSYDPENKKLNLLEIIDGNRHNIIEIDVANPEFLGFIRLMNSIDDEFELTESFKVIAKLINHPTPAKHIKVYQK